MTKRMFAFLFLALALIGAPFGMGRMMDVSAGHATMHQADHGSGNLTDKNHGSTPAHQPSTPHYMVCSACVAAPVTLTEAIRILAFSDMPRFTEETVLSGTRFLPPTPPPRA